MYIFRPRDHKARHLLADRMVVRYQAKHKIVPIPDLPGFNTSQKVGTDKTKLRVEPREPQRANGLRAASYNYLCDNTAAGLKSVVRKVRPEEEAKIAEVDGRIAAHEVEIAILREQRAEIVREAWTKAHVVHLKDVEIRGAL